MKIGILTEIINFHSGSRAPLEIARHLSSLGNHVTVYAYSHMLDKTALESLKKNNVKIKLFKKRSIGYFSKLPAIFKLYQLLKTNHPDVVTFSGTPPFFLAAKLTGIPIVRIYQGVQFDAYLENKLPNQTPNPLEILINKFVNIIIFLIDFTSFRLSNAVICISNYSAREGEILYKRKSDAVIYHGSTKLRSSKIKPKKDKNLINIISVSRITPYKGFHKIISALSKIKTPKKIIFTIVGSQPKDQYLSYLKKIGGNKVRILTDPSDSELANLYRSSDIYASADRYLYFGLPITEAALFGIPAVSLNFAAAQEIISHNKTGFIAVNQKDFSKYFEKLITDNKFRLKMGKAANLRAQKLFSWKKIAKQYHQLLENVVNSNRKDQTND